MNYDNQFEVVEHINELRREFSLQLDSLVTKGGHFIDLDVASAIGDFEDQVHDVFTDTILEAAEKADRMQGNEHLWED